MKERIALLLLLIANLMSSCVIEDEIADSVTMDISYGNEQLQKLDIYYSDTCSNCSVLVFVHGGGWNSGDKRDFPSHLINFFRKKGYVVVSLNYSLSPNPVDIYSPNQIRFPKHVDDVALGIRWVYENIEQYGGQPTNIILMGHSAGAHIVGHMLWEAKVYSVPIKSFILLDGGAYLIGDVDLLNIYPNIITLTQNAIGDSDVFNHLDFFPSYNVTQPPSDSKVILISSTDPYRKNSNDILCNLLSSLNWIVYKRSIQDVSHETILTRLPDYWEEINSFIDDSEKNL